MTQPRRFPRFLFSIFFLVAISGCTTTPDPVTRPRLPFQVAILPLKIQSLETPPSSDQEPLRVRLNFEQEKIAEELEKALSEGSFVRAISLTNAPGTDRDIEPWIQEAIQQRADLLVECSLAYSPSVYGKRNGLFYWNMLIQTLGGPFSWWVQDRTFVAPAELEASFYDLRAVEKRRVLDDTAVIHTVRTKFRELDLAFSDRTKYAPNYLASVIVPVGVMARDNDQIRQHLETEIVHILAQSLAQDIQNKRDLLLLDKDLAPFYVDPDTARVSLTGNGRYRIQGEVILKEEYRSEILTALEIWYAPGFRRRVSLSSKNRFLDEELSLFGDRYYRYPIDELLPIESVTDTIHLTIWDDQDNSRTFTLPAESAHVKQ